MLKTIKKNWGKKYEARVGIKRRGSGYYGVNQFGFLLCVLCFLDNAAVPFKITVLMPLLRPHCCCCSVARLCPTVTPWTAANQASLSFTISWSLLKLMAIEWLMPSNHLVLCRPLLLLPSIFPSVRVFSNESVLRIRWPKYWSFSFSISPSSEYSGLISFRTNWFDLLQSKGFSRLHGGGKRAQSKARIRSCKFSIVSLY